MAVHSLVCTAFHGPRPSPAHQVAHNNGNPADNAAGNLRWATAKENHGDRVVHGTLLKGEKANGAKINDASVRLIRRAYKAKIANQREIGEAFGLTQAQISHIILRQHWPHVD